MEWIGRNSGALSVIFSVIAVIVAIIVPTYIAYSQKKIALFEERYKICEEVDFIIEFCDYIKSFRCYEQYINDSEALRPLIFSAWVISLRKRYVDAWNVCFENNPKEREFRLLGLKKEMNIICSIHLKEQIYNLNKAQYVFNKEINAEIEKITHLYRDTIEYVIAYVFYGQKEKEEVYIGDLIEKAEKFKNSKTLEKMKNKVKL